MEVERQKANRRLEKSLKELTNARWKKKKQSQQLESENGMSLPVSLISETPIVHRDAQFIADISDISNTDKNRLARGSVVDLLERPPTVKTIPLYLQEKLFNDETLMANDARLDKYARQHAESRVLGSLKSWGAQTNSEIGSAVDPFANVSLCSISPSKDSVGSLSQVLTLSPTKSIASLRTFTHTVQTLNSRSSIAHSISPLSKTKTNRLGPSHKEREDERKTTMLKSIESLVQYSQTKSLSSSLKLQLSQPSIMHPLTQTVAQSRSLSQSIDLSHAQIGRGRTRRRTLSPLTTLDDQISSSPRFELGSSLEGNDLSILEKFAEKLAEDGVSIEKAFPKLAMSLLTNGENRFVLFVAMIILIGGWL
jgi:hypothetical protein